MFKRFFLVFSFSLFSLSAFSQWDIEPRVPGVIQTPAKPRYDRVFIERTKMTEAQRHRDLAIKTAVDFLDKNPKLIDEYIQATEYQKIKKALQAKQLDLYIERTQEPRITVGRSKDNVVRLMPDFAVLEEVGDSILEFNKKENKLEVYKNIFDSIPAKYRGRLLTPKQVESGSARFVDRELKKIYAYIDRLPRFTNLVPPYRPKGWTNDCSQELGYGTYNEENSNRCNPGDYHPDGLFVNADFPLKYFHTCIKSQGARGTCTAFGINAAIEAQHMVKTEEAYNLSEQFTYFDGAIRKSLRGRYTYFLNPGPTLKRLIRDDVRIQHESDWEYNPSRCMESRSLVNNTYAKSCIRPNSWDAANQSWNCDSNTSPARTQMCTNYAFQAKESWKIFQGYSYETPQKRSTNRFRVTKRTSLFSAGFTFRKDALNAAILQLDKSNPVVVSYGIRKNFSDAPDHGRVKHQSWQSYHGGHTVVLLGFVHNDQLPARIPKAEEKGYFIMKNSWGRNAGDCGYYYVDFEYLRKTLYTLHTIEARQL